MSDNIKKMILSASKKDFVSFKDILGEALEDKFKTAIADVIEESKTYMFSEKKDEDEEKDDKDMGKEDKPAEEEDADGDDSKDDKEDEDKAGDDKKDIKKKEDK